MIKIGKLKYKHTLKMQFIKAIRLPCNMKFVYFIHCSSGATFVADTLL